VQPDSKIYVAGHRGLAGSAIVRRLQAKGFRNIVSRTHAELDLTDQKAAREFFAREKPEIVFHAAGRVGGILANDTLPADFIYQNLAMEVNVIDAAYRNGVERLVFLGSSCIYPRECPQPMKETALLTGTLEPTNRPYAIAKIAGVEMCWAYNRQYGTRYLCAMPTNLYGPGDNYHPEHSHVMAAMIRKFHEAKAAGQPTVTVWGTGAPRREFLYSDDMADGCIHLMSMPEKDLAARIPAGHPPLVNVGSGEDVTITELAGLVRNAVGAKVDLVYDPSKPDGTPRKLLDISLIRSLGWQPRVPMQEGLQRAYADFLARPARA
jgi:GDP-L-fucose synthase